MQMTATEFAKLIKDLRCDARPDERRKNPRVPTRARVEVLPVLSGEAKPAKHRVWVRDLSRTGLGIMSSDEYPAGSRLLVLLPKDVSETFVLLCEVVRCTRMPGSAFVMGTRLVRRVTAAEYAFFLAGHAQTAVALAAAA